MNEQRIRAWSYSRLVDFEQCPLKAKLKYLDKIPEPERPLPPGKTEHANDRGTRVHEAAERYVRGGVELIPELSNFATEFEELREKYKRGIVSLEGEWAVNRDWEPVAWSSRDAWARIKLDAFVRESEEYGVVIDYKTGRKHGNEVKHGEQMQLYQLAAFMRYPTLQLLDVELWYLDKDDVTQTRFTREQGLRFLENFNRRGELMTSAVEFNPQPNMYSCRWCPFGPKGTGHCKDGVQL